MTAAPTSRTSLALGLRRARQFSREPRPPQAPPLLLHVRPPKGSSLTAAHGKDRILSADFLPKYVRLPPKFMADESIAGRPTHLPVAPSRDAGPMLIGVSTLAPVSNAQLCLVSSLGGSGETLAPGTRRTRGVHIPSERTVAPAPGPGWGQVDQAAKPDRLEEGIHSHDA